MGNARRIAYIKGILESRLTSLVKIYYTRYSNKSEYSKLVGAHIAKAVLFHVKSQDNQATIFIDRGNKKTLEEIKKEIKSFRITYKKSLD